VAADARPPWPSGRRIDLTRTRTIAAALVVPVVIGLAACGEANSAVGGMTATSVQPAAPLSRMVGQTIVVRMPGRVPTPSFLARIRAGQVGGVVLFGENFGPAGPGALVAELQAAALGGGNPPLLIAIDQEGGIVKRLPGAPTLAPPQMASPGIARTQGTATARNLRRFGINVDLAPVLDVGRGGFITPRTFGTTPRTVAVLGSAVAVGLMAGAVMPTAKHFPGLGYAPTTTDTSRVVVRASRSALSADLVPFRIVIASGVPIVMVATASYPGLGVRVPAALSRTIVTGLLRTTLAFRGVVITDALDTGAVTTYVSPAKAALLAIRAGADMVMAAGTTSRGADATSKAAYVALVRAVETRGLSAGVLAAAYQRILRLKQRFAPHPAS